MAKPIPDGYPTLTPYVIVNDGNAALAFYEQAFGARVRLRIGEPDGIVRHAEFEIGNSLIMIADEHPDIGALGPRAHGGSPVSFYLYVEDVDAVIDRAVAAGATVSAAAETKFYGDRTGRVVDPFGYAWHIATHVEDVSEEEIRRRAETAMA
jgi:PhnB protein